MTKVRECGEVGRLIHGVCRRDLQGPIHPKCYGNSNPWPKTEIPLVIFISHANRVVKKGMAQGSTCSPW